MDQWHARKTVNQKNCCIFGTQIKKNTQGTKQSILNCGAKFKKKKTLLVLAETPVGK